MGKGKDQTTNVVAGGCCAICCGICFLVLGLPMLIAGIVMVKLYEGDYDDQLNQAYVYLQLNLVQCFFRAFFLLIDNFWISLLAHSEEFCGQVSMEPNCFFRYIV